LFLSFRGTVAGFFFSDGVMTAEAGSGASGGHSGEGDVSLPDGSLMVE
jgi:hypothetical protein